MPKQTKKRAAPKVAAVTDEAYVRKNGQICPVCGSREVCADGPLSAEGNTGSAAAFCGSCGALWSETWCLVGFCDVMVKRKPVRERKPILPLYLDLLDQAHKLRAACSKLAEWDRTRSEGPTAKQAAPLLSEACSMARFALRNTTAIQPSEK